MREKYDSGAVRTPLMPPDDVLLLILSLKGVASADNCEPLILRTLFILCSSWLSVPLTSSSPLRPGLLFSGYHAAAMGETRK